MQCSRPTLRVVVSLLGVAVPATPWAAPPQVWPPPPPPGQAFSTGVDVIAVDAVVLDREGNPIEGLRAEDFSVTEEGEPQAIRSFQALVLPESAPTPPTTRTRLSTNAQPFTGPGRTFVIVFDNLHMAEDRAIAARESVRGFLKDGLGAGDRVVLAPTSGGAWWFSRIPEGYEDLVAAMERLGGQRPRRFGADRMSDWEAMRLHVYRDRQVGAQVQRRYYENRVILEVPNVSESAELDLGDHTFIRINAAEVYTAALHRQSATLRVLERVAESLVGVGGRKSILLVSEGFVHEPSRIGFKIVSEAARRANAAVYFVDARGLTGLPATADAQLMDAVDLRDMGGVMAQAFLEASGAESVAADSGGFTMKNRNDLGTGLRRIALESRAYYLIGYHPGNTKRDGRFRQIQVEVNRPEARVRARKGYYALPEGESLEEGDDEDVLDPAIRRAVDSPQQGVGIPLRVSTYVRGPTDEGKSTVLVVSEADPRAFSLEEREGRFNGELDSLVMVSSRERGENLHREHRMELALPPRVLDRLKRSWVPIHRDFELAPGVYQALVMLRDRRGGSVGTVRHDFEVPETGPLRTSTPVLTDTLEPRPEGSGLPPRPVPLARRTFAPGKRLFYAVEVYGALPAPGGTLPSVRSGCSIKDSDGTTVRTMDTRVLEPGPGGRLAQMLSFSLEDPAPGAYEIVLLVTDEVAGKTLEVVDPFSVAAPGAVSVAPSRSRRPLAPGGLAEARPRRP